MSAGLKLFAGQDAHHDNVLKYSVNAGCLPLQPFDRKSAFCIGPLGSLVALKHLQVNTVKFELAESEPDKFPDSIGANTSPLHSGLTDTNLKLGVTAHLINLLQLTITEHHIVLHGGDCKNANVLCAADLLKPFLMGLSTY